MTLTSKQWTQYYWAKEIMPNFFKQAQQALCTGKTFTFQYNLEEMDKLIELVKCLKKFKFIEACSPVEGETPKVQFSSEFKEMLKQDR